MRYTDARHPPPGQGWTEKLLLGVEGRLRKKGDLGFPTRKRAKSRTSASRIAGSIDPKRGSLRARALQNATELRALQPTRRAVCLILRSMPRLVAALLGLLLVGHLRYLPT